eukprot:CAMPEP_0172300086 /NCGR_PEP_ID=MMETSP1058-20130122/2260_1 /TAXON_ID=83371 /ORGANISM="Detonula confervacea, Strain CCMP 353" /LENGTH=1224 /DNA_ID=CAMNT_0013009771 /DNA_START=28 /DNA_END=3702 /DNA_ORIENTATION=+
MSTTAAAATTTRICSSCSEDLARSEYSKNQWSKNPTVAKCKYCIAAGGPSPPATPPKAPPPAVAAAAVVAPQVMTVVEEEPVTDAATLEQQKEEPTAAANNENQEQHQEEEESDSTSTNDDGGGSSSSVETFDTAQEDSLLTPSIASYIGAIDATKDNECSLYDNVTSSNSDGNSAPAAAATEVDDDEQGDFYSLYAAPTVDNSHATNDEGDKDEEVDEKEGGEQLSDAATKFYSTPQGIDAITENDDEEDGDIMEKDAIMENSDRSGLSRSSSSVVKIKTCRSGSSDSLESVDMLLNMAESPALPSTPPVVATDDANVILDQETIVSLFNNGLEPPEKNRKANPSIVTFDIDDDAQDLPLAHWPTQTTKTTPTPTPTPTNNSQEQSSSSSLPSYNFQPAITEKSNRILRSYKPSVSQRFRGASSLLAFRGRSSSSTSSAAVGNNGAGAGLELTSKTSGVVEEQHYEGSESSSLSHKKNETRTDVTSESDDNEQDDTITTNHEPSISIGTLLKDTYSFLYIYPACPIPSSPFLYALFLFAFQSLVYALLLSSLIDTSNTNNVLHVPTVGVSLQMRIAQGCAIFIAVFNGVDIMVAMNNLLRTPDAIVVIDSVVGTNVNGSGTNGDDREQTRGFLHQTELSSIHGIAHSHTNISSRIQGSGGQQQQQVSFPTGLRFKFANVLRLIEGCLAVAASFILIVQSDDIIQMFMNFAALEFVVNLDNLAFALAEHGLISDRLQDAARFVDGLGFCYYNVHNGNNSDHRRTKKRSRGGSCTSSAGRLAQLKGSYLSRLFQSPVQCMKNHPDGTRRSTLFIMTVTLFGCWGYILSGLNTNDFLCKSLDVEFFHAHVLASSAAEEEDGIKPFLASRSGTYIAVFAGDDGNGQLSFLDRLSNIFVTGGKSDLLLAYRKADPKVEVPVELSMAPVSRIPQAYVPVVFYDPLVKRWIFASCDPDTDFLRDKVCSGPQVHSIETDTMDLTMLSSAAFHIVDDNPTAASMALPATVTCNECGRQEEGAGGLRSVESSSAAVGGLTCGLSGGECSPPQENLGFARQCLCPPGQYGLFCQDHYGTLCPILEILFKENLDEPPVAAHFLKWEERSFSLLQNQYGVGNTPIWERQYGSKGYTDRVEWRGGTHWTITRRQDTLKTSHTIAIAEGASAMGGGAMIPGGASSSNGVAFNVQPPPAGLMFHLPKSAAWGTQPDFFRPFASYKFHCKAGVTQLTATP